MEPHRILHRRLIAQSFFRNDMEQHRPLHFQHIVQGGQQMLEVVSVNRPHIPEPKLFKEQPWKDRSLGQLFSPAGPLLHVLPDMGNLPQQLPRFLTHLGIKLTGESPVQIGGDGSNVLRDGHLIVVQDDQEVFPQPPGMVQAFQRHPGRHGPIPDNTDDFMFLRQLLTGSDQSKGCGDAGASMARVECIVDALLTFGEPAQPPVLSERMKLFPTPSE